MSDGNVWAFYECKFLTIERKKKKKDLYSTGARTGDVPALSFNQTKNHSKAAH